jgi:hypothetical protein
MYSVTGAGTADLGIEIGTLPALSKGCKAGSVITVIF